jgi:alpha-glutamyl/putrescinyl thymine pyrophosphorylase clade 1
MRERWRVECGEHTNDEIIRRGRFCRVHRQDDRQTRWLHETWLEPNRDNPDVWFLALVYRCCINDGRVASAITCPLPWDAACYLAEMRAREAQGLYTEHYGHHAYTIYAFRGFAFKPEGHVTCLLNLAWASREKYRPRKGDTCAAFYHRLRTLSGVGTFYAGQIVADCKFMPPLSEAPDAMTFAVPGPGSERGLARAMGKPLKHSEHRENAWQLDFQKLRAQLAPDIEQMLGAPLSASDLQSACCETDKLERYRVDHGDLALYTPFGEAPPRSRKARSKAKITPALPIEPSAPVPRALPALSAARDPAAAHVLRCDIETLSAVDLKKSGAQRYAEDPSTDARCCAYAVDDEPVQLWVRGDPVPAEFIEVARNPKWTAAAHNAAFERPLFEHVLAPRYGFPLIPVERWRCTMAQALACALPGKLEKLGEVLGLEHRKDVEGAKLMRLLSQPLPDGTFIEDPALLERLYAYCVRDVEVERELHYRLPPLSDPEQALWVLDATINGRGFHTDGALLDAAANIAATVDQAMQEEITRITDGAVPKTSQVAKLQAFLTERGAAV